MPPLDPQAQQILNQRNGVEPSAPQPPQQPRPVQAPTQPRGPVYGPPVVQQQPTPIQQAAENRAQVGQQVSIGDTAFDNVRALGAEFASLPEVKNYSTVIRQLSSGLSAAPNAAGDQSLIVSYARMLDPASVVRESEFDTTAQADNTLGRTVARLQREFGIEGGGRLSDEARARILQEMRNLAVNYRRAYEGRVADYKDRAIRAGYNPLDVVGQDLGIPYNAQMRAYDREHGIGRDRQAGGIIPNATNDQTLPPGLNPIGPNDQFAGGIEMGAGLRPDGSFDRAKAVRDIYKLEPGQEDQIIAFWNAQRNNQNLTVEAVRSWYQQQGFDTPTDADIASAIDQARQGATFGGLNMQDAERAHNQALDAAISQEGIKPETTSATIGLAGSQGLSLSLADELQGVGGFLGALAQGNNPVTGYQVVRDVERRALERAREANPKTAIASEIAAGLVLPVRGASAAMRASSPVAAAAREGAILGSVAGFGAGEGLGNSLTGAVVGGGTGAVAGAALGKGGQAIQSRLANRAPAASNAERLATQQSADALGIDTIPAMTGGTVARGVTAGARQGIVSDIPIANAVERIQEQGGQARRAAADSVGTVMDGQDAGELVRRGANVFSERTSAIGGRLYERADRMAQGVNAPLTEAIATAQRHMAEIAQSPGGPQSAIYRELDTLVQQMQSGSFPIAGIRAMRTRLRDEIQQAGLRGSDRDRIFGQVVDAAQTDMVNALNAAGRQNAAAALQTANNFWRTRVETIDQVLEPVLGRNAPRSGEQIVSALERMASEGSGNEQNLRRLLRAMPKDEANNVRASIINRLGRPRSGAGEVLDEGSFSFETFLTNYNSMSARARATLFPQEARQALDDLANVAAGVKRAGQSMNHSNTARAVGVQAAVSGGLLWVEPITALAGAAGQYGVGRLMASPRFARWLAGSTRVTNPAAQRAYVERLGAIARTEPGISAQVEALQNALLGANDNAVVTGAVAEPQDQQQR